MKISRNAACPCGSGKKYKKCCDSSAINPTEVDSRRKEHLITEIVPQYHDIPVFTEKYFNDLDTDDISAHKLIYSSIMRPKIDSLAASFSNKIMSRGRSEAKLIRKCKSPSEIVEMMKEGVDSLNHVLIIDRLLENPKEAVLLIVNALRIPREDEFVELAVRVIGRAKVNCSRDIKEIIEKHDKPVYQISILCLLLGFFDTPGNQQFL